MQPGHFVRVIRYRLGGAVLQSKVVTCTFSGLTVKTDVPHSRSIYHQQEARVPPPYQEPTERLEGGG